MDELGVPRDGEVDWEGAEDLTALSRPEHALRLESLREEGRALNYERQRQLLQSRIDLVLAELAGRGTATLPSEELARVLLWEVPARGVAMDTATDLAKDLP
jgi:anti-sigma-K factor RsiG